MSHSTFANKAKIKLRGGMGQKLPEYALSVRQPWAWAIIHAGKDIENRDWKDSNSGLRRRGRIAIHAAKGMTRADYEYAAQFMSGLGYECPAPHLLKRGGIIGSVEIVDAVSTSRSDWFVGPKGLVLRNPKPCKFVPASGALGFFKWLRVLPSERPRPARYMLSRL